MVPLRLTLAILTVLSTAVAVPANVISSTDISPTDISSTDISPTDTSPTDISPTDISPTDISSKSPRRTFREPYIFSNPCKGCKIPGTGVGYLPHATRCYLYYRCTVASISAGKVITAYHHQLMSCPAQTKWNQQYKTCDFIRSGDDCVNPLPPPPTVKPITTPIGPCNKTVSWSRAHPRSCRAYIRCVHGVNVERCCAPGTRWDAHQQTCVFDNDTRCVQECTVKSPECQLPCLVARFPFTEATLEKEVCGNFQVQGNVPIVHGRAVFTNTSRPLTVPAYANKHAGGYLYKFGFEIAFTVEELAGDVSPVIFNGNCMNKPTFGLFVKAVGKETALLIAFVNHPGNMIVRPFNIHTHLKVIFMYDGRTLKLIVNDCTYRRHTSVRKVPMGDSDATLSIGFGNCEESEVHHAGTIEYLKIFECLNQADDIDSIQEPEFPFEDQCKSYPDTLA